MQHKAGCVNGGLLRGRRALAAVSLLGLVSVGLMVLVSLTLAGCGSKTAPDFSGTTIDGVDVSMAAYGGRPLVLAFMASWCPGCRADAPELDKFYQGIGEKAGFLAVAVQDTEADMQQFMKDSGSDFPVALLPDSVPTAYGIDVLPTVVLIDAHGRIAKTIVGGTTAAQLYGLVGGLGG